MSNLAESGSFFCPVLSDLRPDPFSGRGFLCLVLLPFFCHTKGLGLFLLPFELLQILSKFTSLDLTVFFFSVFLGSLKNRTKQSVS